MTKLILSALAAVSVQANATSILYFGAESAAQTKNEYCSYSFTVPQVAAAAGATPKTQAVVAALNGKWKAELATDVAQYNTGSLQSECKDYSTSYQESATFKIATELDATIISIVTSSSGYYGGAHGTYGDSAQTFNAKTGEFYTSLGEFASDSKTDAFLGKVREKLKEQNEGFDPEFGFNDWQKGITTLYSLQNYYWTAEGLVIYFNPYEVGSYAEGLLEAKLYWSEIADLGLLRKEGPATELNTKAGFSY